MNPRTQALARAVLVVAAALSGFAISLAYAAEASPEHISIGHDEAVLPGLSLGVIPPEDLSTASDGGCSHCLRPITSASDHKNRLLFFWGLIDGDKPMMNLGGQTVTIEPSTPYPERMIGEVGQGKTFSELYRFASATIRFDNTITFVCPPDSEGGCELAKFDGLLTLTQGGMTTTYLTVSECGH